MSFDPKTARYGDVYSTAMKNHLYYIGVAPLKRAGELVYVFQVYNTSNLTSMRESSYSLVELSLVSRSNTQQQQPEQTKSQKGSKTMDKNIAAILREDTTTISLRLPGSDQELTYVTDQQFQPGDHAVVLSNRDNYVVGVVVEVHDDLQIEPNSDILYKWVVAKLDVTAYQQNVERNTIIESTLTTTYRKSARRAFAQAMLSNATAEDRAKLQGVLGTSTLIQDGGRNS